jgi:hypothetical protein
MEIVKGLDSIVGKQCWGVTGGGAAGSVIKLSIGNKIPKLSALTNPLLSEDLRKYDGEIELMITCSWRLDSDDEVVCSWTDEHSDGGPMLSGLDKLLGRRIKRVAVSRPAMDLCIEFEGMLILKVFCDRTNRDQDSENYVLFLPRWIYIVNVRSFIEKERRESK